MKTMTDTISAFGKYRYNIFAILLAVGFISCDTPAAILEPIINDPENAQTEQETQILDPILREIIGKEIKDLNPDVVGEHIIFNEKWLDALETVRVQPDVNISKEEARKRFITWRDRMDQTYECYKELTGTDPVNGTMIYADFIDAGQCEVEFLAHYHTLSNRICVGKNNAIVCLTFAIRDSYWNYVMLHEISHIFDVGRCWDFCRESTANLKVAYAYEKIDVKIEDCYENDFYRNNEFRKMEIEDCVKNINKLEISSRDDGAPSKIKLYNYSFIDLFDWEIWKQFFHRNNKEIVPFIGYETPAIARQSKWVYDELCRIAGVGPEIFKKMPDGGKFYEELVQFEKDNQ